MGGRRDLVIGDSGRAVLALILPFATAYFVLLALRSKGYSPMDVGDLLTSGQLTWSRQLLGLAALIFWLVRYSWPALLTILSGKSLAWMSGQELVTASGAHVPLSKIKGVRLDNRLFSNSIVFDNDEGVDLRVPATFTQRDLGRISSELKAATKANAFEHSD